MDPRWARQVEIDEKDNLKRLANACIPLRYRDLTWEMYTDEARTEHGESVKQILIDYCDNFHAEPSEGLVLVGTSGQGKTYGVMTLCCDLVVRGVWAKFTTYADLVDLKRSLIPLEREGDATGDYNAFNLAKTRMLLRQECDLLVLDDIGKEYRAASGYGDDYLDWLLRSRLVAGKATVLTSNFGVDDFSDYNDALPSLVHDVGEIVVIQAGPDQRRRRREERARARRARRQQAARAAR